MSEYFEDIYQGNYDEYVAEEAWVHGTTANVEEIIKKYGVDFFIDKLPRYSKIALTMWKKKNVNTG